MFRLLVELGANPWMQTEAGKARLQDFSNCLEPEYITYLLQLPCYDPSYISPKGWSHLDMLLGAHCTNGPLLDAVLDTGVPITEQTQLVLGRYEPKRQEIPFEQLYRICTKLTAEQLKCAVRYVSKYSSVHCYFYP